MATAKKTAETKPTDADPTTDAQVESEPKDTAKVSKEEREAQRANVVAAGPQIVGGPTQADLNPAYAPPREDVVED